MEKESSKDTLERIIGKSKDRLKFFLNHDAPDAVVMLEVSILNDAYTKLSKLA